MNYTIIPLLLMLGSLAVMIIIFIRKYPQLTLLDVDNIPEVKEGKKKEEFLRKRIQEKGVRAKKERQARFKPVFQQLKSIQLWFRRYVGRVERRMIHERERQRENESPEQKIERKDQLRSLIHEGVMAAGQGDIETAEKKFIAAIRIDAKNKEAYRGLADAYSQQGQVAEARETYQFLLSIDPADDNVLVKLAELAEVGGNLEQAIEYYEQAVLINDHLSIRFARLAELLQRLEQYPTALEAIEQAVELEPLNPKYLDSLAEISIMVGDKELAESAYQELRKVNPENQKLVVLRERIQKLR